jgi:hypothetical protein
VCEIDAIDADGDGHSTGNCKALDGSSIVLGDDCDDSSATTYPGAWDGPKGDGHPNLCDGIDQNCDGLADDSHLDDGTSCTCAPGDVQACSQDASGKMIAWPLGKPSGACKAGAQTCLMSGTWGPCIGAVEPGIEVCNGVDDDCNGLVDDGPLPDHVPIDAPYWAYDGDNDTHGRIPGSGYQHAHSCTQPTTAPVACTSGAFDGCTLGNDANSCCPPTAWKFAQAIPDDDCDDEDPKASPAAAELCSTTSVDDNCDGQVNEGCICDAGTIDTACSSFDGVLISWPAGVPEGACKYGSRTCAPDGKSWSECVDAIPPAAQDNCAIKGDDSNCDGVPNEGCACELGDTQSCGSDVGSCKLGQQSCDGTGHFGGACVGGVTPLPDDTCDAGNDANCDGIPNEQCQCINGAACGSATTCNAGEWTGCIAGAPGTCNGGTPQAQVVWTMDGDGDGYCNLSQTQLVCPNAPTSPAPPWVPLTHCTSTTETDCDDTNPSIHPHAMGPCDGNSYDCTGNPNPSCGCVNGAVASCWSGPAGVVFQSAQYPNSVCVQGKATCQNGVYGTCMGESLPKSETCNGIDDDCDGLVDDGVPPSAPCSVGVGECQRNGQIPCSGGVFQGCNVDPGAPSGYHASKGTYGTCDWNCDGTVTIGGLSGSALSAAGDGCPLNSSFATSACPKSAPAIECDVEYGATAYCGTTTDAVSKVGTSVERLLCAYTTGVGCLPSQWTAKTPADTVACK